jgi:very-short-patch-repair endonuclease
MAAAVCCDPPAALSHRSAAALWGIGQEGPTIEVSTSGSAPRSRPGVRFRRRPSLRGHAITTKRGIPVTTPIQTLVDLATCVGGTRLERAVNEADKHDLVDPEALRAAIDDHRGEPGVALLRTAIDRRTFRFTDSALESRFLALVRGMGLPLPLTRQRVNGFLVDFYWPDLGIVVETDGLRYHRTPGQQARDRLRDQAHVAAGLTALHFTHGQVHHEADHVRAILESTFARSSF